MCLDFANIFACFIAYFLCRISVYNEKGPETLNSGPEHQK